ncbi:MAG: DNA polymerase III subunit [Chloroflexi bacterium]|nr:DNA polymerase III subunit [Chloroflexota bacterium]
MTTSSTITTAGWRTVGHEKAVDTLARSARDGRFAHAWLLAGPAHVGKMTLAMDIARLANCTADDAGSKPCGECRQCRRITDALHADVRVISQDGTTRRTAISVDQIRELQGDAILKPYEGRRRVFIIEDADNFTQEAANALLKMLEEPPDDVIFVLLASEVRENTADESAGAVAYNAEREQDRIAVMLDAVPQVGGILPTILSRCQVLQLRPLPMSIVQSELDRRFDLTPDGTTDIARISAGRLGWALQAAADPQVLANRNERLDEIEAVLNSDLANKFKYAERMALSFGRSRDAVYDEMQLWLGWWRDVLVVNENNEDLVLNLSRLATLQAAASACASRQIVTAIRAVQETTAMLESNVNARLCIEGLMLRMPELEGQLPVAQADE